MQTDSLGIPQFTEQDLINMIYNGHVDKCTEVLCSESEEIELFNNAVKRFGLPLLKKYSPLNVSQAEFDRTLQAEWFMPDEYKNINVLEFLVNKCSTEEEVDRVKSELQEYEQRDMLSILRYMIYLVDLMRKHKIVWGVGRGSSVASFVLYLIGIHRINSIQYGLDFHEFMR